MFDQDIIRIILIERIERISLGREACWDTQTADVETVVLFHLDEQMVRIWPCHIALIRALMHQPLRKIYVSMTQILSYEVWRRGISSIQTRSRHVHASILPASSLIEMHKQSGAMLDNESEIDLLE